MSDEIFEYGTDEAIKDGVLHHPYPARWPWLLITNSVHADCENKGRTYDQALTDCENKGRTYDQALTPLLMDCLMEVKAKKPAHEDFPLILENTVAGTVWIMPNEKGGMTVMKPEDY